MVQTSGGKNFRWHEEIPCGIKGIIHIATYMAITGTHNTLLGDWKSLYYGGYRDVSKHVYVTTMEDFGKAQYSAIVLVFVKCLLLNTTY